MEGVIPTKKMKYKKRGKPLFRHRDVFRDQSQDPDVVEVSVPIKGRQRAQDAAQEQVNHKGSPGDSAFPADVPTAMPSVLEWFRGNCKFASVERDNDEGTN